MTLKFHTKKDVKNENHKMARRNTWQHQSEKRKDTCQFGNESGLHKVPTGKVINDTLCVKNNK